LLVNGVTSLDSYDEYFTLLKKLWSVDHIAMDRIHHQIKDKELVTQIPLTD